ncbi:hypothetical protein AM587_10001242 [Phytophthora nicotianae]|uniref:Retrotransposon gag domain-containing protein n=1 Tax=Phytophthora nicotianae TaxID=4792 RepID=A0A0W8CD60_PHYNI|nr:hypothetical protein AM587_10001242 [Phytophthora nicotianae]
MDRPSTTEAATLRSSRQFVAECDRAGTVRTWVTFKTALRKRFRPPSNEYMLREKLCKLTQTGPIHDYVGEFQNILVQCQIPISPLELRFYFQQGIRKETGHYLKGTPSYQPRRDHRVGAPI